MQASHPIFIFPWRRDVSFVPRRNTTTPCNVSDPAAPMADAGERHGITPSVAAHRSLTPAAARYHLLGQRIDTRSGLAKASNKSLIAALTVVLTGLTSQPDPNVAETPCGLCIGFAFYCSSYSFNQQTLLPLPLPLPLPLFFFCPTCSLLFTDILPLHFHCHIAIEYSVDGSPQPGILINHSFN